VVNFGKYAGRTLKDIAENEPGFLRWIIKSDFPDDVRSIAEKALIGIFPERKKQ
jgi:DNA polymerase-3 subunit epsilon